MLSNNSNNKRSPLFFDENLKLVSYCPLCDSHYNLMEAKVLEERDDANLIYIRCRKCQSSILALVLNNPLGVSSVGLVTDLSADEVMKYRQVTDVTEDDVLETHELLQKIGNVLELVS